MPLPVSEDIAEQIAVLTRRSEPVDAAAVRALLDNALGGVQGDLSAANLRLFAEVRAVADFINSARAEIASLCPDEITSEHLPTATDELEAIVGATENATNVILESMEELESLSETLDAEAADKINDSVTRVYEACSFQDITGQRIGKVVNALQHVENKVNALVEAFGGEFQADPASRPVAPKRADGKKERPDEHLCNGPQLPGNEISQDDIDALMGSD